jgi:hypothetical protein
VDLFDQAEAPLNGSSKHNEGKIHLGLVYAADDSLQTARLMMSAAACFSSHLRRWIGSAIDAVPVSSPFYYVVHRDSILPVDRIRAHLAACRQIALEHASSGDGAYFGSDFQAPSRELTPAERDRLFDAESIAAAFLTPEIAIDPIVLAKVLREHLRSVHNVRLRMNTRILAAGAGNAFGTVRFEHAGSAGEENYDHIVNALWAGRLVIDATAGVPPSPPWLWRVKHYMRVGGDAASERLPSVTIVLGPFGDVVNYPNNEIYLSWYPVCCTGRSTGLEPPMSWLPPAADQKALLREEVPAALSKVVPGIAHLPRAVLQSADIGGGIIFARGQSDVDDPASGLHRRRDIGVYSRGRYHSIDTGKYATAPLFAVEVAARIRSVR